MVFFSCLCFDLMVLSSAAIEKEEANVFFFYFISFFLPEVDLNAKHLQSSSL